MARKRGPNLVYFVHKEMEQIMSTLKDPYDVIEWDPNRDRCGSPDSGCRGERGWRRMSISRMGSQWIGQIYDLITLFTLAAALAAFFWLLLN